MMKILLLASLFFALFAIAYSQQTISD